MTSRVYDPIHDVFQSRDDPEDTASIGDITTSLPEEEEEDEEEEEEEGSQDEGDSTQSDENLPALNGAESSRKRSREPSKYLRHLKKADGEYFTRQEIQYEFLHELCSDKRPLFTNWYQDSFSISATESQESLNVTDDAYVARKFIKNDKLTFSEYYLLTIASSTKCSKILRDKLLFDRNVAFSTCALSLLVNTGRLNTTINFFLEMTSQLRTFHSIPCLQRDTRDPKSLQDTPRLKSILKNLPKGNGNLPLAEFYESPEPGKKLDANPVNVIFHLCDNSALVNSRFLQRYVVAADELTFFDILENTALDPRQRARIILWMLYVHLETDFTDEAIAESLKLFGVDGKFTLNPASDDVDVDTPQEVEFGELQKAKRKEFLLKSSKSPHNGFGSQDDSKSLMEQRKLIHSKIEDGITEGVDVHLDPPILATSVATVAPAVNDNGKSTKKRNQKSGSRAASKATATTATEDSKTDAKPVATKRAYRKQVKKPVESSKDLTGQVPVKEENPDLETAQVGNEDQSTNSQAVQQPKKRQRKKAASESPATQEIKNDLLDEKKRDEMEELIKFDKSEKISEHRTHDDVLQELGKAQALARRKREELGLLKLFQEYEDVTMATVIGVRGKKRKKFRDGVLGYETDFIRTFNGAKRALLSRKADTDSIYEFK
ncbi:LAFA_0A05226g1_1 [Lachancea sp. 'fantastica']|nr:LAFA_0A05226g1_1 [Lachancea sp. 'fantastica']